MPSALLIAHGQPADPAPQEVALAELAARVGAELPHWRLDSATLAADGALQAAIARADDQTLIYPFFMAQGWFTTRELPRRLAALEATHLRQLAPFGVDPALPALMADVAVQGARAAGLAPDSTTLLLAAHGSQASRRSADSTYAMADHLRALTPFARITQGFVEEAPYLADSARDLGPAICLPFFALRASHVREDLPHALAEAGFDGPLLPAIGEHDQTARLIARALTRAV